MPWSWPLAAAAGKAALAARRPETRRRRAARGGASGRRAAPPPPPATALVKLAEAGRDREKPRGGQGQPAEGGSCAGGDGQAGGTPPACLGHHRGRERGTGGSSRGCPLLPVSSSMMLHVGDSAGRSSTSGSFRSARGFLDSAGGHSWSLLDTHHQHAARPPPSISLGGGRSGPSRSPAAACAWLVDRRWISGGFSVRTWREGGS